MDIDSQPRPQHARNVSSSFSILSGKSDKSSGSKDKKPKLNLTETEEEKRKARFDNNKSFANPNRAITEDQPVVRAQEATTLASLSTLQHKDWQGNVITDPDKSNPARSRLERPLDTIRSFEAAIDGGHSRRAKLIRAESVDLLTSGESRRGSMLGSDINIHPRSPAAIPTSAIPPRRPSQQRDFYESRGPANAYPRRAGPPRMTSAPVFSPRQQYAGEYSGYPQHQHNESYDTTAYSSGTSEPWTNTTDPSSENSSIDRIHAARYSEGLDTHGMAPGSAPYGQTPSPSHGPIAEESWHKEKGFQGDYNYQAQYQGLSNGHVPPPNRNSAMKPLPAPSQLQKPQQSRAQPAYPQQPYQQQPQRNIMPQATSQASSAHRPSGKPTHLRKKTMAEKPPKRKSWIKRAFGMD